MQTAFSFLRILRTIQRECPVHLAQGLCDHLSPRYWFSQGGPCGLLNWSAEAAHVEIYLPAFVTTGKASDLSMPWLPHLKGSGGQTPACGMGGLRLTVLARGHTVSFRQCVLSAFRQFHC